MDEPVSRISFRLMALAFKVRDLLRPRMVMLEEAGIEPGYRVLDYGCGPGSYIAPLAELVGASGKIYALDIHPLAIKAVENIAARKGSENIETIKSDCSTGLPDSSMNVVLLYDVFHDLSRPGDVLRELRRVLQPDGVLSFSDHHMRKEEILAKVTGGGMFRLMKKGRNTFSFARVD